MITKKQWAKLLKKWDGKVYQRPNERVIQRLKWFSKKAKLLKGLNVLEIGCNAGLMAVDANKYVNMYIGSERKEEYYQQALVTKKSCKLEKCTFIKAGFFDAGVFAFENFDNSDTAIILSRVLYHLWDKDVKLVLEYLYACNIAIVICGTKGKGRTHNDYDFAKPENVTKFFKSVGMDFKIDYKHERFFCGVATR